MSQDVLLVHGLAPALRALVLDSPHSGSVRPADFDTLCSVAELRDGEDCFIDELYLPATASGVPLLAAQFPRTYIDANRHAGDIDLDLLDGPWPHVWVPSGKALLWRTLDDGRAGVQRADFVLGDRDGTTCAPEFTAFVRDTLVGLGYAVKVNDPFKGVELVRAYADPAAGRHSLQLEINKRLYMDAGTLQKSAGFTTLQAHLMHLVDAIHQRFSPQAPHV